MYLTFDLAKYKKKKKKKKPVQAHLNVTSDEWNYDRAEIRVKRQCSSRVEVKLTTFAKSLV